MYGEANAKRLAGLVASGHARWDSKQAQAVAVTLTAGPQGNPAAAEEPLRLTPAELQWLLPMTDPSGRPRTPVRVGGM
jgi:hypothetical protein